jgi:hypothetical protein
MIDDIIFNCNEFYVELPVFDSGNISLIDAQTEYFVITLPVPEAVSIFIS